MEESTLPVSVLKRFTKSLRAQVGMDALKSVFEKAGLPTDWANPARIPGLDDVSAAQAYSQLQGAMRTYYGRGARGILFRIGSAMWEQVLNDAPFVIKAQSKLVRALPAAMRFKPTLDMLAKILSACAGDVTVHTLDLDWLFVDRISPTTLGYREDASICFVTQGLIRESLFWATGREFDIEETSCRAMGKKECEFKIITGVKS
jgi:predicted hydrocarbon binding protein